MNDLEDIGHIIREKVGKIQQTSDEALWSGIEATLKQRRQRKKAFVWILNTFLLLLVTIGIIAFYPASDSTSEIEVTTSPISPTVKNSIDDHKQPAVAPTPANASKTEGPYFTLQSEAATVTEETTRSQTEKDQKIWEERVNLSPMEEDQTRAESVNVTKTIYHYYNSKDGQKARSMDKTVIDSVLTSNRTKGDSILRQ